MWLISRIHLKERSVTASEKSLQFSFGFYCWYVCHNRASQSNNVERYPSQDYHTRWTLWVSNICFIIIRCGGLTCHSQILRTRAVIRWAFVLLNIWSFELPFPGAKVFMKWPSFTFGKRQNFSLIKQLKNVDRLIKFAWQFYKERNAHCMTNIWNKRIYLQTILTIKMIYEINC